MAGLAADRPELTVVVDHLGKPPRHRAAELPGWERALRAVGRHPNTVAKVSGLQCPGAAMTASALRPVWHVALETFGPDRLMFGSDWPMTIDAGGYGAVLDTTRELVGELTGDEQAALWHGTAVRIYGDPIRREPIDEGNGARPSCTGTLADPAENGSADVGVTADPTVLRSRCGRPPTCC